MAKQLSTEQINKLKEPLPAEAVKPHPTKTFLSSIKAIYVIERLNDVFGIGSWHLKSEVIDSSTAMIVVKSTLSIPDYGIELESYGGNDNGGENSKNHDLGDAYKGAVTDATTKICSYLGIAMDVYKGKADRKQDTGKKDSAPINIDTDKPWLTEKQYHDALARITKGEREVYSKVNDVFKMKKEWRENLIAESRKNEAA